MLIDADSTFFFNVYEDYKKTQYSGTSRIIQDYIIAKNTRSDYKGREVYELLQNAEDQKSEFVLIELDTKECKLSVSNGGGSCTSFSERGFCSIMMAHMSPKLNSENSFIGCKGLGFRSLLNWANQISIYSSGVCCKFSNDIIKEKWNELKKIMPDNILEEHMDFAKREGVEIPMSMLSVPSVCKCKLQDEYTTKVEVIYKEDSIRAIKDQIESLSGKVLLFLSNIKKIVIFVNEEKIDEITRIETTNESTNVTTVTIKDTKNPNGVEYVVYKDSGNFSKISKKYQVCIAYNKSNPEDNKGEFLYTFFPTKVRISLPCVIHATFDLNSSRNSLNDTEANKLVQEKIAENLKNFAVNLAVGEEISWNCVTLLHPNDSDRQNLPLFCEKLKENIGQLKIYPTVHKGYMELTETVYYSEELAEYASKNESFLDNHLIQGFTGYGIQPQFAENEFIDSVNLYSQKLSNYSLKDQRDIRAELVKAVSTLQFNCDKKLYLLLDSNGKLISNNIGRINVGVSFEHLPDDMNVSYVDKELLSKLSSKFDIGESDKRGLTQRLKKCMLDVGDFDVSAIKQHIITYSQKMNEEGFVKLMYALFLKSQENSDSFVDMFKNPGFCLLAKDGSKHYPSELVVSTDDIYEDCHKLYYSINEWVDEFKKINIENIEIEPDIITDFFCMTVGVSNAVPMKYISMDENANEYLETYSKTLWNSINDYGYYYTKCIEEKNPSFYGSRCRIIDEEFINRLKENKTLSEILEIIINDATVIEELKRRILYFQQRTVKSEDVEIGYSLYKFRNIALFKQLSMYVVAENIVLNGDDTLQQEINKLMKKLGDKDAKQYLSMFGARDNVADLGLQELYEILNVLPDKGIKRGVQKLYKSIRDVINSKISDENFEQLSSDFKNRGRAYARKAGGELEVVSISKIYYWDNEQLPHQILDTKYKLELPSRVGELSVKSIFGVTLWNEIKIEVKSYESNTQLSNLVKEHITERIRYILAYRLQSSRDINDYSSVAGVFVSTINKITVEVCSSCSLCIDEQDVTLKEGDMVSVKDGDTQVFYVCTGMIDIDTAFKIPSFCENITEILCISLKVTSAEMANCFRGILKNTLAENDFISKKEVAPDIWDFVNRSIGLSDAEKDFWTLVAKEKGLKLENNKLSSLKKTSYLKELLSIDLPIGFDLFHLSCEEKYNLLSSLEIKDAGIIGGNGLYDFYLKWTEKQIVDYKDVFSYKMFNECKGKDSAPQLYYNACSTFTKGEWILPEIKDWQSCFYNLNELTKMFWDKFESEFMLDKLNIESHQPIQIGEEYISLLEERGLTQANITQEHLAYTLFEGYKDDFVSILNNEYSFKKNTLPSVEAIDNGIEGLEFSFGVGINKPHTIKQSVKVASKHGGHYVSERDKHKAGLMAEQKVYKYMCNDSDNFENVRACSRNLDPVNGDDSLHYDIMYCIKNEPGDRFLEVKSMSGDTILLSKNEYDFALKNAKNYDFAIVQGNSITILKTPFVSNPTKPGLQVLPETYSITMEIRDKE